MLPVLLQEAQQRWRCDAHLRPAVFKYIAMYMLLRAMRRLPVPPAQAMIAYDEGLHQTAEAAPSASSRYAGAIDLTQTALGCIFELLHVHVIETMSCTQGELVRAI